MTGPTIKSVRLAAAHEGIAELVVDIQFDNGGVTEVALDRFASQALMDACQANSAEELVGQSWELVRDALNTSYNRF
ncbi:MAG TPA: hypothetical protein VJ998_12670 [Pseudomonadales bacterium]|nr:hypothetical protein [Pseudomonadales bacterium]